MVSIRLRNCTKAGEMVIHLSWKAKVFRGTSLSSADLSVLLLFEGLDLLAEHMSLAVTLSQSWTSICIVLHRLLWKEKIQTEICSLNYLRQALQKITTMTDVNIFRDGMAPFLFRYWYWNLKYQPILKKPLPSLTFTHTHKKINHIVNIKENTFHSKSNSKLWFLLQDLICFLWYLMPRFFTDQPNSNILCHLSIYRVSEKSGTSWRMMTHTHTKKRQRLRKWVKREHVVNM